MTWGDIIQAEVTSPADLPGRLEALFDQQRAAWPALADGVAALAGMRTRVVALDGAEVVIQANPGRRKSTHARVDPTSVAKRPCFLCPANMPDAERGLAFGPLVILPNPYPVLPGHCTVPVRDHVPQRIAGHTGTLLALAEGLGESQIAFYNGPACGASAPDHLHFQACRAEGVPLIGELPEDIAPDEIRPHRSAGRRLLVFGARAAEAGLRRALSALAAVAPADPEPMVNLLALRRAGQSLAVLVPRARHRPTQFFAEGHARIAVSPAALEMAGVLVVAEPDDLNKVDSETVRDIYAQVSLDEERFSHLVEALR